MRLTNKIKEEIIKTVVKKSLGAKYDVLDEEYNTIVQETADALYSPEIKKWMAKAPPGGLNTRGRFKIKNTDYAFNRTVSLKNPILVLARDNHKHALDPLEKHVVRLQEIDDELKALKEKEGEIIRTMSGALAGVTTRKRAIEAYPELESVIPEDQMDGKNLAVAPEEIAKIMEAIPTQEAA